MYALPMQQPLPAFPQAPPAPRPAQPPAPAPAGWQAVQPMPVKARGVAPEPAPAKFVLPSPAALGIKDLARPVVPVDWQAIQARMANLGVLRYRKDALAGGVQVTLLLPTADPARGLPVEGRGDTEASAVLAALTQAEAARTR